MKINYKKMPFLGMIDTGNLVDYLFCNYEEDLDNKVEWMQLLYNLNFFLPKIHKKIAENVVLVSRTYCDAMMRSEKAFNELYEKDKQTVIDVTSNCCGCYIFRDHISDAEGAIVYYHDKDGALFLGISDNDTLAYAKLFYKGRRYEVETKHDFLAGEGDHKVYYYYTRYFMLLRLMEKYAKVETKVIPPGTNMRLEPKLLEQTKNESKLKIHYRDSRWFTEIVRNEGFTVSGHFRLQPKKVDGEWTKELIYINEFQKHGYHRRASINIEENENDI